jgi:GntR family transcriptional regulator/MocR family aminotransferase
MHLTLRLPPRISDRTLAERALAARLNPRALSGFALQQRDETNGLVIGYGGTAAEQLVLAVRTLARLAREIARE